jgi:hypothetical protein
MRALAYITRPSAVATKVPTGEAAARVRKRRSLSASAISAACWSLTSIICAIT